MRSQSTKSSTNAELEIIQTFDNEGKAFQELMEEILKELIRR